MELQKSEHGYPDDSEETTKAVSASARRWSAIKRTLIGILFCVACLMTVPLMTYYFVNSPDHSPEARASKSISQEASSSKATEGSAKETPVGETAEFDQTKQVTEASATAEDKNKALAYDLLWLFIVLLLLSILVSLFILPSYLTENL